MTLKSLDFTLWTKGTLGKVPIKFHFSSQPRYSAMTKYYLKSKHRMRNNHLCLEILEDIKVAS